jgi:hypothetical protein
MRAEEGMSMLGAIIDSWKRSNEAARSARRAEAKAAMLAEAMAPAGLTPEQVKRNSDILSQWQATDPNKMFNEAQAQRRKQRLTAAKEMVAGTLYDVVLHEPRSMEAAADAIENLIRTIMEEK